MGGMQVERTLRIRNRLGVHARAAVKIVELGGRFASMLYLGKDGQEVDGKSILSILSLSCGRGSDIHVRIVGEDADVFMEHLVRLVEDKFGEER